MCSLKEEHDSLQEGKAVEANEEIHSLRLDAEEAAALHENEVARLQEEICLLKAELESVQRDQDEYDMEVTALRAEIKMKRPGIGDSQSAPKVLVVLHFDDRLSCASEEVARLQAGLLEDERFACAQQTEIFTKEIQRLQGAVEIPNVKINELEEEDEEEEDEEEDNEVEAGTNPGGGPQA
nr:coiled-coil domain-containing protein 136-like [Zootoca vivipara]